jgi:DNA-binding transcriptional LysR family regulator
MVIPDRSVTIGAFLAEAFERSMIGVESIAETNSIELLKRSVSLGETVAFLSEIETKVEVARGEMVFLHLRDSGLQSQELRLIARRTAPIDPVQSRVAEELRQMLAAVEAQRPGEDENRGIRKRSVN